MSNTTSPLAFRASHRRTRIAGTAVFAPKWRRTAVLAIDLILIALAAVLLFLGAPGLACVVGSLVALTTIILFWARWGMLEYSGLDPIGQGETNLSDLVTADLVKVLSRATTSEAIAAALAGHWQVSFVLRHAELPLEPIQSQLAGLTPEAIYAKSYEVAKLAGQRRITAGSIVVGMAILADEKAPFLRKFKLTQDDLIEVLVWLQHLIHDRMQKQDRQSYGGLGRDFAAGYTNFLDRFGQNMSDEVEAGSHVFSSKGREDTVDELISVLNQPVHPAAALVGPNGGGKTTLVYTFAERILSRTDVGRLTYRKVMKLSANALLSAATPELPIEKIVSEVMYDAVRAKNVILFFDDAQAFFTTKAGAIDISEILLPILQTTHLPMIFVFTDDEWTRFAQLRQTLMGQMTKLVVAPIDATGTLRTLEDVALEFEAQQQIIITLSALREAVKLSDRYTTVKGQPGAAIDLLRASFSHVIDGRVGPDSVQKAIEVMTGVKTGSAGPAEAKQLLDLENLIHERMINQTQAVSAVAGALRRARAGVKDAKRPIGSFLFLGPTGVGKTELAKSLAAVYFGGEDRMIRLDMSEYQQVSDISRLLAAATESGAGSSFLERVRQQPYSVVLLDEIEKAHPDILNLILQLLDEGRLTDTAGKAVSFKDAIIILTSNALADDIRSAVSAGQDLAKLHDGFIDKMISLQIFKPELLNRFDEIVTFRPLTADELVSVVAIMVKSLNQTLAAQQITLELTDAAKRYIVEIGNDPRMGARPMRRTLQRVVEDRVSQGLLKGEIQAGQTLTLDRVDLERSNSPKG